MGDSQTPLPVATLSSDSVSFDWGELDEAVEYYRNRKYKQGRPPNSFTAKEYAAREGLSRRAAQGRITKMKKQGIVELAALVYEPMVDRGGVKKSYYYRVKRG